MPNALFLGQSFPLDWVLHATLIEGGCKHSRLGFTANSLRLVNAPCHTSITPVYRRGCQSIEVVVGEGIRATDCIILRKKLFATISLGDFYFCLVLC